MDSEQANDRETLAEAFWSVSRTLRRSTHTVLAPLGITPGQGRALAVLLTHGTMRISELSEHLRIAARSTTEVVDALEADLLVTRLPDDSDRRATLVALTPRGREVGSRLSDARLAEAEALFGRLDERDRDELRRILGLLRSTQD